MRRRLISAFLAVLILVGLLPAAAITASADSAMTTSEEAIAVLKLWEGYSEKAYRDNGQWSIGYGCRCDPADYPDGITETEADALLRDYLLDFEGSVNSFAADNGLTFTQNQFDAMVLFTYNVGSAWLKETGDFRTAVIQGLTGNAFIYYMTRWCTVSGTISTGLINRRLAEADMFLNGYYAKSAPSCYSYVLFDGNGGTYSSRIQGYDASAPVDVMATATYSGQRFLGWYTEKNGGQWVSTLDSTTKGLTLYAHWQSGEGDTDEEGNVLGSQVSYQRIVAEEQAAYGVPSSDAEAAAVLAEGTVIRITADYVDANGVKWGLTGDGWVELTNTDPVVTADAEPDRSGAVSTPNSGIHRLTVTVTGNAVNYRSGAGTGYTVRGVVYKGQQLNISEVVSVNGSFWGKFSGGWICLTYTDYNNVVIEEDEEAQVIATGTVKVSNTLRVRSGAGTGYSVVASLANGAKVDIYEITANGSTLWGRIESGWISLDYVIYEMVEEPEAAEPEETEPEETEPEETEPEETEPEETEPEETEPEETEPEVTEPEETEPEETEPEETEPEETEPEETEPEETTEGVKGVVTASALFIRSGPGTKYSKVGYLAKGEEVLITEQTTIGGSTWGRIEKGWISMTYVELLETEEDTVLPDEETPDAETPKEETPDAETPEEETPDAETPEEETPDTDVPAGDDESQDEANGITGVVTATALYIRSGAGTGYAKVGFLRNGEEVTITEQVLVNGTVWGKIDQGWISMTYVRVTSGEASGYTVTVTASVLCIRAAAGTSNAIVGRYYNGDKVVVYETAKVGTTLWGRTDKGWISMSYVK